MRGAHRYQSPYGFELEQAPADFMYRPMPEIAADIDQARADIEALAGGTDVVAWRLLTYTIAAAKRLQDVRPPEKRVLMGGPCPPDEAHPRRGQVRRRGPVRRRPRGRDGHQCAVRLLDLPALPKLEAALRSPPGSRLRNWRSPCPNRCAGRLPGGARPAVAAGAPGGEGGGEGEVEPLLGGLPDLGAGASEGDPARR